MSISVVAYRVAYVDQERSRITDLAIVDINGTPHLISTTRYDGVLQSWQIADGTLAANDILAFDGGDRAGGHPTISALQGPSGISVQIGGGAGGTLQTVTLNTDGTFGAATPLASLPPSFAGLGRTTRIDLADGRQVIYGALAGEDGIAAITYDATAAYLSHTLTTTPAIAATVTTQIAGQTFLFTANIELNAVNSWSVDADGALIDTAQLTPDDGLWINAPSAMATTEINGVNYLLLGAAGSGTISVMEVGSDGSLTIRDHLTDDRTTRFAGIATIEVIQLNERTYVLAGGADDGVSIFQLLEGGYLIAREHIADTVDIGLDNISDLAAVGRGAGLDIFAASSSEAGVTQLRFDTGTQGVTTTATTATIAGGLLLGTDGNDILQGHDGSDQIAAGDGDDILRDGNGTDTLTGGAGADLFIMSADGLADTITDFTLGEDKLDLSLWPLLRDISQLTMQILPDGFEITYGDEVLTVFSADGALIDYRDLTNGDLLGNGIRLGTNIAPGYPGPAVPPPDIGNDDTAQPADPHAAFTLREPTMSVNAKVIAALRNAEAVLSTLQFGSAGDDDMTGTDQADVLFGRAGADCLSGGAGADVLRGGAGDDMIDGGSGDDLLIGDLGADTFIFNGGTDEIADFDQGVDGILLDPELWAGLTSAADVLAIYGSINGDQATIRFDDDNALIVNGISNFTTFADDISLF